MTAFTITTPKGLPDWRTDESLQFIQARIAELEAGMPALAAAEAQATQAAALASQRADDAEVEMARGKVKVQAVREAATVADQARRDAAAARLNHRDALADLEHARAALTATRTQAQTTAACDLQDAYRSALGRMDAALAEAQAASHLVDELYRAALLQFPMAGSGHDQPTAAGLPQAAWAEAFGTGHDDWATARQRLYAKWRGQVAERGWL